VDAINLLGRIRYGGTKVEATTTYGSFGPRERVFTFYAVHLSEVHQHRRWWETLAHSSTLGVLLVACFFVFLLLLSTFYVRCPFLSWLGYVAGLSIHAIILEEICTLRGSLLALCLFCEVCNWGCGVCKIRDGMGFLIRKSIYYGFRAEGRHYSGTHARGAGAYVASS